MLKSILAFSILFLFTISILHAQQSENRDLNAFTSIDISGPTQVILEQSDVTKINESSMGSISHQ